MKIKFMKTKIMKIEQGLNIVHGLKISQHFFCGLQYRFSLLIWHINRQPEQLCTKGLAEVIATQAGGSAAIQCASQHKLQRE